MAPAMGGGGIGGGDAAETPAADPATPLTNPWGVAPAPAVGTPPGTGGVGSPSAALGGAGGLGGMGGMDINAMVQQMGGMGGMGGMNPEQMSGKIAHMSTMSHPIDCPYSYTAPRLTDLRCCQP
jgi:hypothetical protein